MNLTTLNQQLEKLIDKDGIVDSRHNDVVLFRSLKDIPKQNYLYGMSLVFVLSGYKRGYLNDTELVYDKDHILIMATELAFKCEGFVGNAEKLQGVIIRLDLTLIQSILAHYYKNKPPHKKQLHEGAQTIPSNKEIHQALSRMLIALGDDFTSHFLVDGIIREILFYVMQDSGSAFLSAYTNYDGYFFRVCRSIRAIHENLRDLGAVEELAKVANMSLSTYYRAFKKITGETPNQYIKNIRLVKAKNLIENEKLKVGVAANEVGYANFSHFTRDFRKQYGVAPSALTRNEFNA